MKSFQQPNIRRRRMHWAEAEAAAAALIHQNTCTRKCFCGIFDVCFIQQLLFLIHFFRFFFVHFTFSLDSLFPPIFAGTFYDILTNMLNAFKQINEDVNITCAFSMRPQSARQMHAHIAVPLVVASLKCTRVKSNERAQRASTLPSL